MLEEGTCGHTAHPAEHQQQQIEVVQIQRRLDAAQVSQYAQQRCCHPVIEYPFRNTREQHAHNKAMYLRIPSDIAHAQTIPAMTSA